MSQVTIYTMPFCPYCVRAKKLLKQKKASFDEIPAAFNVNKKREMMQRAGGAHTFPQIFVGDTHVGGCDELMAMERAGKLDALLVAAS